MIQSMVGLLLALVLHQPSCRCLTRLGPPGTPTKRLAEFDVKLAYLDTKLYRLTQHLNAVMQARYESERRATGLNKLLDDKYGMHDSTCPEGFAQCGDCAQCIRSYLLCDGDVDCRNGHDEDPTFCDVPFKSEDVLVGRSLADSCVAGMPVGSEINTTFLFVEPNPLLKGVIQAVTLTLVKAPTVSGLSVASFTYSHATKRMNYELAGLGNTRRLGDCYIDYFDPEIVRCQSWRQHQGEIKVCFQGLFKLVRRRKA